MIYSHHTDTDSVKLLQDDLRLLSDLNDTHVVLVDLSMWTRDIDLEPLVHVLVHISVCDNATGVVAHSSGTATHPPLSISSKLLRKLRQIDDVYQCLTFEPFNDAEAAIYWQLEDRQLSLQDIKALTNYNPLLLKKCANQQDRASAVRSVWTVVKGHITRILKSLDEEVWQGDNVQLCLTFLTFAANNESIPIAYLDQYVMCWLELEQVTYVTEKTQTSFALKPNFPQMVDVIVNHLCQLRRGDAATMGNDIIKGFIFEEKVLAGCTKLELVYNERKSYPLKSCSFPSVTCVKSSGLPFVGPVALNCLHRLRARHPVIDAVGKLQDQKGKEWLLLVQVSSSEYKRHKSKAIDLMKSVTGPERNAVGGARRVNWLNYYSDLFEVQTNAAMYVYISPKEIDQVTDPAETLGEAGEACMGVVQQGTCTHIWIKELSSELSI